MWEFSTAELESLAAFCERRQLLTGPPSVSLVGDGHSNLTFLVDDGARQLVLRRPPPPPTPPGAHDVLREARLLGALAGQEVPIPELLATAPAGQILDVDCYLMSYVPGVVATDRLPPELSTPAESRRLGDALVDTLVALHAVDPRAVGLADFGRAEGFNRRHLTRMSRLIADERGAVPLAFAALTDELAVTSPPESGHTLLHNDFRIGNVILAPGAPARIAAVLDWELATLGDPLFDLGYLLAGVPQSGEPVTPTQAMGMAQTAPGFPTRRELAARYEARTGRSVRGLGWYLALANWKLAVLYEYSRRRGVDPYYQDPHSVPLFLDAGAKALAS